jgi:hypothetical protein
MIYSLPQATQHNATTTKSQHFDRGDGYNKATKIAINQKPNLNCIPLYLCQATNTTKVMGLGRQRVGTGPVTLVFWAAHPGF